MVNITASFLAVLVLTMSVVTGCTINSPTDNARNIVAIGDNNNQAGEQQNTEKEALYRQVDQLNRELFLGRMSHEVSDKEAASSKKEAAFFKARCEELRDLYEAECYHEEGYQDPCAYP